MSEVQGDTLELSSVSSVAQRGLLLWQGVIQTRSLVDNAGRDK